TGENLPRTRHSGCACATRLPHESHAYGLNPASCQLKSSPFSCRNYTRRTPRRTMAPGDICDFCIHRRFSDLPGCPLAPEPLCKVGIPDQPARAGDSLYTSPLAKYRSVYTVRIEEQTG